MTTLRRNVLRSDEFEFAGLGKVQIRGKVEPVEVWAVIGVRRAGLVGQADGILDTATQVCYNHNKSLSDI